MFLAVGVVAVPASADSPPITKNELAMMQGFWAEYGVDSETQKNLVRKIRAGELTDAELLGQDDAVSSESVLTSHGRENVFTFVDGSVSVTSLEAEPTAGSGIISPAAITGCITSGTPGRQNGCKVSWRTALSQVWFYSDYSLLYDAYDKVHSAYNWFIEYSIGFNVDIIHCKVIRGTQTATLPARGELKMNFSSGITSGTRILRIDVMSNTAKMVTIS